MNKKVILFHLRESLEELKKTIREIDTDQDYCEIDLEIGMGHLYHHLNTAWNGRNQTDDQHRKSTKSDFNRFRRFPKDSEFSYLAVTLDDEV